MLIIVVIGGVTLYISNNYEKKSNDEIGKEIYNDLRNIHNKNVLTCNTVYTGWSYSKSKRGSFRRDVTIFKRKIWKSIFYVYNRKGS